MGIPIDSEKLISFAEAADRLPSSRPGKRVHASTLWRWARYGCKACDGATVKLEWVRAGSTSCTSVEALQRFVDRLALSDGPPQPKSESAKKAEEREKRRQESVTQQLRAYGFK